MRINGKYHKVNWDHFKEELRKNLPEVYNKDYKFKKNELKELYKIKLAAEREVEDV